MALYKCVLIDSLIDGGFWLGYLCVGLVTVMEAWLHLMMMRRLRAAVSRCCVLAARDAMNQLICRIVLRGGRSPRAEPASCHVACLPALTTAPTELFR